MIKSFDTVPCPYCGTPCEADWVDVGVGYVQCGPFYCQECGASEIGGYDDLGFDRNKYWQDFYEGKMPVGVLPNGARITYDEYKIGWYAPGQPVGSSVNTFKGKPVDHKTAKMLYDVGLLDENPRTIDT